MDDISANKIKVDIAIELGMTVSSNEIKKEAIAARINEMINSDMHRLISFLYRLDINENKLRMVLAENKTSDAGMIITELIIERQLEKIKTRQQFRNESHVDGEEQW